MNCIFNDCKNLEYVNLQFATLNQNVTFFDTCINNPPKLTICSENGDWQKIFNLTKKQYINCISNISSFSIEEEKNSLKCFKKNIESDNPCLICGNNFLNKSEIINNITYINCYEYKENNTERNSIIYMNTYINIFTSIYSSINTSFQISTYNNKNTTSENFLNPTYNYNNTNIIKEKEINNRTQLIENIINNLFKKLNISNIDNGNDEKDFLNNISIIITSIKNQKNNENNKDIITIDLDKCENILKDEYNISKNDPLYMLQIISEEEKGMKIPKIEYEVYSYPSYNNTVYSLKEIFHLFM